MTATRRPARRVAGRSLVELLIALTLALVLVAAALFTVAGTGQTTRQQDALARLDEDGSLALALMAAQLRQAGFSLPRAQTARGVAASHYAGAGVRGCDHGFVSVAAADEDALACAAGDTAPAAFTVAYEADTANTWPASGGQPTDCAGSQITARASALGGSYVLAENRFFIRVNAATGNPTLYCAGSGGTGFASQPLIDNVEDLRLSWGVAAAGVDASGAFDGSRQLVRYLSAAQIDAEWPADPRRWSRVVAVRLCVTLRTAAGAIDAPASHVDCAGERVQAADAALRRLRRSYETTVFLRNRGESA